MPGRKWRELARERTECPWKQLGSRATAAQHRREESERLRCAPIDPDQLREFARESAECLRRQLGGFWQGFNKEYRLEAAA
jgi:hypothetical protein